MTTIYEVRICDSFGNLLAIVGDFVDNPAGGGSALGYVLNVGNIGALRLTLPATFDDSLLVLDGRIGVWRSINGRPPTLDGETVFFIRTWEYTEETVTVTAYSANELRRRRIIDYFAGTSFSSKSAVAAGNQIKAFVAQNMVGAISAADRQGVETQVDISAFLTNQANLGDGQNIAMQAAWRNLHEVIRDICDASTYAGTYMAADIVATSESTLELRTYANQRGTDHTASSAQPVILSPETGSLANCRLIIDRSEEVTFAVAGGGNVGTERLIATSLDAARMAESPLNRIEDFGDYNNITDPAALQDVADAMVRAGRPRIEFFADVVETDGATRGIHYDYGDKLTGAFRGLQYDSRLDVIEVAVGGGGQYSRAKIRSVS